MFVLGGSCWPIGWSAGFIGAPFDAVWPVLSAWTDELEVDYSVEALGEVPLVEQLRRLEPLESPYSRRLLVAAENGWTAYFDNDLEGGDPFPWVGHLSSELSCHGVLATHVPWEQYRFPATQFELLGPEGEPPLHYVRTVSAGIFDSGRWSFAAHGAVQPFEQMVRYGARRVRDRLTREMLVQYLQTLGIHADDPDFYGTCHLLQENATYKRRTMSVEQVRSEYTAGLRSL